MYYNPIFNIFCWLCYCYSLLSVPLDDHPYSRPTCIDLSLLCRILIKQRKISNLYKKYAGKGFCNKIAMGHTVSPKKKLAWKWLKQQTLLPKKGRPLSCQLIKSTSSPSYFLQKMLCNSLLNKQYAKF